MAGRSDDMRLEHLQEAALREVIWTLGGSTRRLEAAFGGARGILGFEDFVRGLQTIGFEAEDLTGCGFKDPAEAFRVLDRSRRGCLLLEEVTRRPDAKIRKLCGRSTSLRRSASSDSVGSMSIGSTGSDLYSAREELDIILGLLREREQEIQLLRTEMNSLREEQDRQSAAEFHRALKDLSSHHRSSMEQLQESRCSNDAAELERSAEAKRLNEKSIQSSERLLLEEQDCLRMEVNRQRYLRVIKEAEESMHGYRLRHQESMAYLLSLREAHAELEDCMADLKPSETAALRQQLHEQSEELHILESQQNAEEAQEAQLRRDVKKLRQDLSKSDSRRRELLTTVAHGVSELSEEIMAGHLRTKSEVDFAEKKLADVKNEFETKTAELRALTKRMDEARLYTETESKDILRRSKEEVQRTRVESRQKEEELQKELMELQQRSSQLGQSNGVQQAEQNARAQARQEQHRQRRDSLRAELQAARERAANLALKCEQTWQSLTAEKRRAAQIAEIRGPHASHAQSSQPYTALTEGKLSSIVELKTD